MITFLLKIYKKGELVGWLKVLALSSNPGTAKKKRRIIFSPLLKSASELGFSYSVSSTVPI
jgi:hypothetical protein